MKSLNVGLTITVGALAMFVAFFIWKPTLIEVLGVDFLLLLIVFFTIYHIVLIDQEKNAINAANIEKESPKGDKTIDIRKVKIIRFVRYGCSLFIGGYTYDIMINSGDSVCDRVITLLIILPIVWFYFNMFEDNM